MISQFDSRRKDAHPLRGSPDHLIRLLRSHLPLKGKAFRKQFAKRLPLEGKLSPQVTDEVCGDSATEQKRTPSGVDFKKLSSINTLYASARERCVKETR